MGERVVPLEEITEFKRRKNMFISPLNLFKRADHWVAKMMYKPFWGAIASAAVGLYSAKKQAKAGGAAASAAEAAAEKAYQRALPWDVSGSFGEATYDQEGKKLTTSLSEPWQSEYDLAMSDAAKQRGYISGMEADPMAAGKKFYEQQKALYAPEQEEDRLNMEKRLLGQGMFGSTGGAGQMNALLDAQAQQDLQAQYSGLDQAQGYIDTYRGRSATDLSNAQIIGKLPDAYGKQGQVIGSGLSASAQKAGQMESDAAQARGQSQANKWGSYGKAIGGMFG